MAIKKSELYSSHWSSCDELRAGIHADQFRDYVSAEKPGNGKEMVEPPLNLIATFENPARPKMLWPGPAFPRLAHGRMNLPG